nr:MAG TPA: hypothetical protein [Caudoviricetes sp.]
MIAHDSSEKPLSIALRTSSLYLLISALPGDHNVGILDVDGARASVAHAQRRGCATRIYADKHIRRNITRNRYCSRGVKHVATGNSFTILDNGHTGLLNGAASRNADITAERDSVHTVTQQDNPTGTCFVTSCTTCSQTSACKQHRAVRFNSLHRNIHSINHGVPPYAQLQPLLQPQPKPFCAVYGLQVMYAGCGKGRSVPIRVAFWAC